MGRFLFVVPPLTGHINPTVPVGLELAARGHDVLWCGNSEVADLLPAGTPFRAVAQGRPEVVDAAYDKVGGKKGGGVAAFIRVWRDFVIPMALHLLPGLETAVDDFRPDALLVDQQTLAGAIVAERRGLPWATSATTPAEVIDPLLEVPYLRDWLREQLTRLLLDAGFGAERAAAFDPRQSPHLVLAFTTLELLAGERRYPGQYAFVGPSIGDRLDDTPFPWEWVEGDRPLVFISLGTINWLGGERFFRLAAEVVAGMDLQAVLLAPDEMVPTVPPNLLVTQRVPQLELLRRVDAVVCHAGYNTVCETLAVGRPLVLAPIRDDQPLIAELVTRAGAGIQVPYLRLKAPVLADALHAALTEPAYREAAQRMQKSFADAGGVAESASRLEGLLGAAVAPPAPAPS